ncbi:MAG: flavodoxin [Segetibacter sp.]|nr:flavodoxin [Segetibacter sp.]
MKAIILLATLKKEELSNTQVLSEFLAERLKKKNVETEIIKLVQQKIMAGTYNNMGPGDEWPAILTKIEEAELVIFATPIWWSNMSSEMQRVIERLDNIHDEILEGKPSRLENKVGGIVITGDSDGAQHIIADVANFFNAIGIILPPYATLSVMYEGQAKGAKTTREELWKKYEEDYASTADKMVGQLLKYAPVEK